MMSTVQPKEATSMQNILSSTFFNHAVEPSYPTLTSDPATDSPLTELPTPYQPNWLLALVFLTILSNRLYQVLVAILYILREWKQKSRSENK
jgi:hypothetical protein